METKMLLLFGMPRSGTTWFGKIFDSHPDVLYLHEPDTENKIEALPRLVTHNNYSYYREIICQYSSSFLDKCAIRINGKLPFFYKSYLSSRKYTFFRINLVVAKIAERMGVFIPIWNPFKSNPINNCHIVWKSIESCGRMGVIMNALPECKAIYIIRHPCGQIASVINGEKFGKFSSKISNADDYGSFEPLLHSNYALQRSLSLEKIKKMKPIERLALRWVLYNEQAIEDIETSGMRGMIVRYEDICKNPILEIKKLYEFAELTWTGETEQFIGKSISGDSESYYSVFKNPEVAMTKWKKVLSSGEINIVKKTISESKAGALFADNFSI